MALGVRQHRRGGRSALAVLVAVVFLAIVGASAGYAIGRARLASAATAGPPGSTPGPVRPGTTTTAPASSGRACLPETEAAAKQKFGSPGGLVQILYIGTARAEVWICKDSVGTLFYQGHRKSAAESAGGPRETLVDLSNALLLNDVNLDNSGRYVATNHTSSGTTRYYVSTTELVINTEGQPTETQAVTYHVP